MTEETKENRCKNDRSYFVGIYMVIFSGVGLAVATGISADGAKIAYNGAGNGSRVNTVNKDGSNDQALLSLNQFIGTLRLTGDGSGVVQLSANTAAPAGFPLIVGGLARATMSSDGARVLFSFRSSKNRNQLATLDINPASLGEAPALTDITVNPDVVAVNQASNATIRVKINTANNVSYVGNVALLNGLRDSKVTNRIFSDDGASVWINGEQGLPSTSPIHLIRKRP